VSEGQVEAFTFAAPDAALEDLAARLAATRWFDDVFDDDARFGPGRSFVRGLCADWARFDWRTLEARLNREPQIVTEIDGLRLHAIHRRSSRPDALPLLLLHGWPSSPMEFLDLVAPLAEPPAGQPTFHVVAPFLPGYGLSTTRPGVSAQRTAALLFELMDRLGYNRFLIQGGNWGALIGAEMARERPERLIGLHLNSVNGRAPADRDALPVTAEEQAALERAPLPADQAHFLLLSQTPASLAPSLNDSPAGLAAFLGDKFAAWSDPRCDGPRFRDFVLGTLSLYWLTSCTASSGLYYFEFARDPPTERYVAVPTAAAVFPEEIVRLPRAWAERCYNIVQWTLHDRGGHFPAVEAPEAFVGDVRAFARRVD
jgi:microsomal epoxide hydrolase